MNPFSFFSAPARHQGGWFSVGLTSAFPDVGDDENNLAHSRLCNSELIPGCKIFHVPQGDVSQRTEMSVASGGFDPSENGEDLKDQVLVFQFRGKFHAIDNVRCLLSLGSISLPDCLF